MVEIAQNILHVRYLFTDAGPLRRQINEELVVRVLVICLVQSHDTAVLIVPCVASSVWLVTTVKPFLFGHHSFLQFIKDREKLSGCLFNVGHGRLELVCGVEAAQVVSGLIVGLPGERGVIDCTWSVLTLAGIQTFISTVCLLLRQEAAE